MTHGRSHAPNAMIIMGHKAIQCVCNWNTQEQPTVNNTLTRGIFYHIREDKYQFHTPGIHILHEKLLLITTDL